MFPKKREEMQKELKNCKIFFVFIVIKQRKIQNKRWLMILKIMMILLNVIQQTQQHKSIVI